MLVTDMMHTFLDVIVGLSGDYKYARDVMVYHDPAGDVDHVKKIGY